ncbi:hypothetical protein NVP1084O_197 [Vibrio phage 1.084.O._10N.261.49.F5]|nr:hypothetical protein NVP1084O_197 [Vibrio phage 1.084.O._10N.261.49.F5]
MGKCKIGERFTHWVVLDNRPVDKRYKCECFHCGNKKDVNASQLFDKRLDWTSKKTKCRECTKIKVGSTFKTTKGFNYEVIKFLSSIKVLIRFESDQLCPNGYEKWTSSACIKSGTIDYPFERNSRGVGYMGCERGELPNDLHIRDVWSKMLQRCYKPDDKDKKGYSECKVCDDWHSYKNFYLWYKSQQKNGLYEEGYQLDKDLLKLGNKVYCPEYCRLVPEKLNSFLNNFSDSRGTGLPNGVNWKEANKKYQVSIKDENSKRLYLGLTDCIVEGDLIFRKEKNRVAHLLAVRYEGRVCKDVIQKLEEFSYPLYDFDNHCYIIK